MGLVGNMDIVDNMMLRSYRKGKSIFLDRKRPQDLADRIINELKVNTPDSHTAVRTLSGGNVQKVLVGREIAAAPAILMTAYPVRGLDINSSYTIYNLLNEQKEKGVSVIFVGEDLDVLMALSDRILVLSGGKVSFIFIFQCASVILLSYIISVIAAYNIVPMLNIGITDEFNKITLYMYTFTYRTPLYLAILVVAMTAISTVIPLFKILTQKIIDVINERDK
jgi:energy-coupling factor transporter ATP-binding protein EcfA2